MIPSELLSGLRNELHKLVFAHSADIMAGLTAEEVLAPVMQVAVEKLGACFVQVWSVDPRQERLVLLTQQAQNGKAYSTTGIVDLVNTYTGEAVEARKLRVRRFPEAGSLQHALDEVVCMDVGCKSYVTLPIRNTGNPHQVTTAVDVHFPFQIPLFAENDVAFQDEYRDNARLLAASMESNLRERTLRMSARVSRDLSNIGHVTLETACEAFAECLRNSIATDWVTVYLENWDGSQLAAIGNSLADASLDVTEDSIPASVDRVKQSNREFLCPAVETEAAARQLTTTGQSVASGIVVPLHDVSGRCKGVVRCMNLQQATGQPWRRAFTYDDIAIVEAMERAFAPLLNQLLDLQRRDASMQNLAHELRVPIIALRAVTERMGREYNQQSAFKFRFRYLTETATFIDLMQRQLQTLQILQVGPHRITVVRQPTRLESELIVPAIRFLQPSLRQRSMNTTQISYYGFEFLPILDVDRALLTQIVFNVLENAVKYFPRERKPSELSATVSCEVSAGDVLIHFEDNGRGISDDEISTIFDYATRGRAAYLSNVTGSGIGLWMCREIARRHGGDLTLTSPRNRTRFTLRLKFSDPISAVVRWPGSGI